MRRGTGGTAGTQSGNILQLPLTYKGIPITKSGYLYIYVSNATPGWDVFFDNLIVKTYAGPMLEESHYYPFGLTMAGISDKALKTNYVQNKYRFNGGNELQNQEFSDGIGFELYDAVHRMYDPQLGRFGQIDPLAFLTSEWSAYAFALDNPMLRNDPTGLKDSVPTPHVETLPTATVVGHKKSLQGGDYNGQNFDDIKEKSELFFNLRKTKLHQIPQLTFLTRKWRMLKILRNCLRVLENSVGVPLLLNQ